MRLALEVLDAAAHEEGLLRILVEVTVAEPPERVNRLGDGHERARDAGEGLGDKCVLREETLDSPRPADDNLVLLGQFVDAEDGDDVLQFLVALQDLLGSLRDVVVILADVCSGEDA